MCFLASTFLYPSGNFSDNRHTGQEQFKRSRNMQAITQSAVAAIQSLRSVLGNSPTTPWFLGQSLDTAPTQSNNDNPWRPS
jgi:hypothetical protein